MRMEKIMVLIVSMFLFGNLHASLLTHLKFEDNFDNSMGEFYNGTNGPTSIIENNDINFSTGIEGRGIYFDGNDYVEIAKDLWFDPHGDDDSYSISMWVKSNSAATTSNNNCYIGKHDDTYDNIFLLGYWSATLRLQIGSHYATISTATEPTEWTHYVVTASETSTSTTAVVYKNGENIWTGTIADTMGGTFQSNYQEWVLGMDWDGSGPSDRFYGLIDNVRFYKKYLSAVDVKHLYKSEFSGLRFCNVDQDSNCTVTTETDQDLSQAMWWVYNGFFYIQVPYTSIESIKVSEGWEAYLCTSTNSQGTCHYFDDGVYESGTGLPSELLNSTYSITVQPKTFDAAKKYFGYKKVGESGNLPVGFAYFYQYANYTKPSKSSDRRRLFMDSENRYQFQNLSNTILGAYRASAAELYGNVYAILEDNSYNEKYLMTSHRDFAFYYSSYPDLDFREYDDDVKNIYLAGSYGNNNVGSAGWFIASDAEGNKDYVCLKGVNETINDNEMRIECLRYDDDDFAFEYGVGANNFFERVYSGNNQKFNHYADNYNLLMLAGHGFYYTYDDEFWRDNEFSIAINNQSFDDRLRINDSRLIYDQKIGEQSTKWIEMTSCQSLGKNGVLFNDIGDLYYNVLSRLNGVGGYKNNSAWGGTYDTYNYYEHWDDLAKSTKTVSKAWTDSWSETYYGDTYERDARFLTLENCNCTQTTSCTSYMLNDYFFNVQTGPMDQKSTLTGYDYYCFRDREAPTLTNYTRTLNTSLPEETYPGEFSSYSIEPVADSIIEELMGIKIGGKETRVKGENDYSYKDDYMIMKKSGKNFSAIMNRTQESFRYDSDWEYEAKDRFEEARAIAETLTTLDLEYAGISKDTNEAFEVGGNGESLGKSVNSISFVFRPRINGVPVLIEDISVEYDAEGLYQIRSRVPYSISVARTGIIKTKNEAVAEMSETVKIEEAEKGNVVYTLDENGELILSYVTKDEEKREFKTISLEAKDE